MRILNEEIFINVNAESPLVVIPSDVANSFAISGDITLT